MPLRHWAPVVLLLVFLLPVRGKAQTTTLKVDVRLVPLHVVVRDSKGNAIGHLSKEDFELLDNGQPQEITQFAAEQAGPSDEAGGAPSGGTKKTAEGRFTVYLFDDFHFSREDLMSSRDAAERQLARMLPNDRVAIFSASGHVEQNFTADHAKLHDALSKITPMGRTTATRCPHMNYYMADMINRGDSFTLADAAKDALLCEFDGNPKFSRSAEMAVRAAAREEAGIGRVETQSVLTALKKMVMGVAPAPGQRTIVLVSPGFYNPEDQEQVGTIDLALRSSVTISVVDGRGLTAQDNIAVGTPVTPEQFQYRAQSDMADAEVLSQLADGTGGTFFHNNNDIDDGFRRTGAAPEFSYLLAFSPYDLKQDGHFHKLKVQVKNANHVTVQARNGYYAPGGKK